MAYDNANTIMLTSGFRREEGEAGETITPGHLVEVYDDSGDEKIRKHSTQGGTTARAFAVEDPLQAKSPGNKQNRTIDDDYVEGERIQYNLVNPGARVQAWLKAGESVVKGDALISGGDGTLIKETGSPVQIVGHALEDLDNTDSIAEDARIDVQVQ